MTIDPLIRDEERRDRAAVRAVNERAFGARAEADLVEALHDQHAAIVALVAEVAGNVVGHILFSEVDVDRPAGKRLAGLAPMAVAPHMQRAGVGSRLVRAGLQRCAAASYDGVVVLGHPEYYPRFGFLPASQFGLGCEYDVQAEAFMVLPLPGRSLSGLSGVVRYHAAFAQV